LSGVQADLVGFLVIKGDNTQLEENKRVPELQLRYKSRVASFFTASGPFMT
jgi:hypothetical protein